MSEEGVLIISVSVPFVYFVPRFSCVSFVIRQITFNAEVADGTVHTYDGFIRDDSSLALHDYPAVVDVFESCFVEVGIMFVLLNIEEILRCVAGRRIL